MKRKAWIVAAALALLAWGARSAAAQDAVAAGDYVIGPKDVLTVSVLELPELNGDRRVSDAGSIDLPMIGEVFVGGLTPSEVRERIGSLLMKCCVNRANVTITVKEFNNKPVSVLGAVLRPGTLSISGRWTLIKAITAAGGLSDRAGKKILVLRRADNGLSDTLEISTQDLFESATPLWNIPIYPADVINVVPRSTYSVFCLGEVKNSGAIQFDSEDRMTLLSVIAKAGGLSDRASKKIRIKRRAADGSDKEMVFDYKRVLAGEEPDPVVEPNDVIVVKESFF
jgi:polysaccharide export outer membrane protein